MYIYFNPIMKCLKSNNWILSTEKVLKREVIFADNTEDAKAEISTVNEGSVVLYGNKKVCY